MRIAHIITNLGTGGAETMLLKLVAARSAEFEHTVISLRGAGTVGPRLVERGAEVVGLGLASGRVPGPSALRLVGLLNKVRPDVVQGWMYHGNLAAILARPFVGNSPKLMWSIRCSFGAAAHEKMLTRGVINLSRVLSSMPECTIYNSTEARRQHAAAGFDVENTIVIPNGFDVDRFRPDVERRAIARSRLGIDVGAFVVGHVARVHPMKDQQTLFEACATLSQAVPDLRVISAGRGMDRVPNDLPHMRPAVSALGDRLVLLPEQPNVEELIPSMDVLVLSSSWGEGFPNVLGEAMACGVPCIATDVGESKLILGDLGAIVPPRSPDCLAEAILRIQRMPKASREKMGMLARKRVVEQFSIRTVVREYEGAWTKPILKERVA